MLTDRYGLALSTRSTAARDAYVEACDLILSTQPGPELGFERAIAADPNFALAHAGRARAHQLRGDGAAAHKAMATANALAGPLDAREAGHMAFHDLLINGKSDAAVVQAKAHLREFPRDAMVLSPCSSVFGLIGFSGRAGREIEQRDLLDSLAPHYDDDWWFNAQHAFALIESGARDAARPKIERAIGQNPHNANAAHIYAHMQYEDGAAATAHKFLAGWLENYPKNGPLHGHLSWHLALTELEAGDIDAAFRRYTECFAPASYQATALLVVADAVSFLWRAELAGAPRDMAQWQMMHDYAHKMFPKPSIAYADTHIVLADAVIGATDKAQARVTDMEAMAGDGQYASGPVVPALSRGFAAFSAQDYAGAIAAIEPVLHQHERIGGSRAQRDLVEFTLLKAYAMDGRADDVRRMLRDRRPGPIGIPVAGLPALH